MKVGLFIPCYVNVYYPRVAIATLKLLEALEIEVAYPMEQTCCGQPLGNAGFESFTYDICQQFIELFSGYDYVVSPSGSCVYHVQKYYDILPQSKEVQQVRSHTLELSDFLMRVMKVKTINAKFPYKVGIQQSCHGLRGLRLGNSSECVGTKYSSPLKALLRLIPDVQIVELDRADECCGFGGTFAVSEKAISIKMGNDRLQDCLRHNVEVITATDMSCLMHLQGLVKKQKLALNIMHIAEILTYGE